MRRPAVGPTIRTTRRARRSPAGPQLDRGPPLPTLPPGTHAPNRPLRLVVAVRRRHRSHAVRTNAEHPVADPPRPELRRQGRAGGPPRRATRPAPRRPHRSGGRHRPLRTPARAGLRREGREGRRAGADRGRLHGDVDAPRHAAVAGARRVDPGRNQCALHGRRPAGHAAGVLVGARLLRGRWRAVLLRAVHRSRAPRRDRAVAAGSEASARGEQGRTEDAGRRRLPQRAVSQRRRPRPRPARLPRR